MGSIVSIPVVDRKNADALIRKLQHAHERLIESIAAL